MEQWSISGETARLERPARGRVRAAVEIAFVASCVLVAEWAVIPVFGRNKKIGMIPVAVVLLFSFLSHRARGETAREIGFSRQSFVGAFRILLAWMIPVAMLLAALGWRMGSLHLPRISSGLNLVLAQVWLYLWGLMQQYALQAVVNRRAQEIWGKGARSIMLTATLFAALHLPNPWLTAATFWGGVLWAAVYQKTPNLYANALSHSLMTTVLSSTISHAVLHGMRVGYNYF